MQQRVLILVAIVFALGMPYLSTANILDYIWSEDGENIAGETRQDSEGLSQCDCTGPTCQCCVDFNITYIDLGGPGCVQMKYISQEEGLKLNVSYGENLLHSQQVKGPHPNATCMALLTNIAEICARFSDLLPFDDGLAGCLLLEPKLLGAVTASFKIGCFTMGPNGMVLEKQNVITEEDATSNSTQSPDNQNGSEIINGDLLAVVNETAEQGLAFLGNLLGLAFSETQENESETENPTVVQATVTSVMQHSTPSNT